MAFGVQSILETPQSDLASSLQSIPVFESKLWIIRKNESKLKPMKINYEHIVVNLLRGQGKKQ